ncbi:hypothetical protein Hanom_Chr16g01473071 [Helianthus anomalus]
MPNTLQAPVSVHLIRLFQEKRTVWYTINCNPLPKDYKQRKMEDDFVHEHDIAIVTDKSLSSVSEEYET